MKKIMLIYACMSISCDLMRINHKDITNGVTKPIFPLYTPLFGNLSKPSSLTCHSKE